MEEGAAAEKRSDAKIAARRRYDRKSGMKTAVGAGTLKRSILWLAVVGVGKTNIR
jgi:hypothetical protein